MFERFGAGVLATVDPDIDEANDVSRLLSDCRFAMTDSSAANWLISAACWAFMAAVCLVTSFWALVICWVN